MAGRRAERADEGLPRGGEGLGLEGVAAQGVALDGLDLDGGGYGTAQGDLGAADAEGNGAAAEVDVGELEHVAGHDAHVEQGKAGLGRVDTAQDGVPAPGQVIEGNAGRVEGGVDGFHEHG